MGAVQDRAGITLATAKARLGVTSSTEDDVIQEIVDMALEAADNYLNNPFVDDDGTELAIPALVRRGVYKLVAAEYNAGDDGVELEATNVKEGDIQVALKSWDERVNMIAATYWQSCRLEPGL